MLFYISIIFEYILIMLNTVDRPRREWRYTDHQQQRNTVDEQHRSIGIDHHLEFVVQVNPTQALERLTLVPSLSQICVLSLARSLYVILVME